MNYIKINIFILLLGLLSSCARNVQNGVISDDMEEEINKARSLFMRLDDSLTVKEKELLHKLETFLYEGTTLKNGKLEINFSKDDFKKMGVPDIYYSILKSDIEDINRYNDTLSAPFPELFEKSWLESVEDYYIRKKPQPPE